MTKRKTLQQEVADVMAVGAETPVPTASVPRSNRVVTDADLADDAAILDDEAPAAPLDDGPADVPDATAAEEPEPVDDVTVDAPQADVQTGSNEPVVRGGVNRLVTSLLLDAEALTYEQIVERVRAEHPGANTTARSVASTASVLRRKGTAVPKRRRGRSV